MNTYIELLNDCGSIVSDENLVNVIYDYFVHSIWAICSFNGVRELFTCTDISVYCFFETGKMLKTHKRNPNVVN